GATLPRSSYSVPSRRRARTISRQRSMAASHGADGGSGGGRNRSRGTVPSQTALCTGLLTVWYRLADRAPAPASAPSAAPGRRASRSLLPPRRRAVSAKLGPSRPVSLVALMTPPRGRMTTSLYTRPAACGSAPRGRRAVVGCEQGYLCDVCGLEVEEIT